jgi:hypothetical protein
MTHFHPTRQFTAAALNAGFAPDCCRSLDDDGATGVDPQPPFAIMPRDDRGGSKTAIPALLSDMLTTGSRQFVEQRRRFFQIGGVEPLGEPAVDRREKIAGFGAPALLPP